MTTVKVKEISAVKSNGSYETEDKRYKTNKSLIKVIKYCIKNGFSFKVGFNDNALITNKKYIEITDEWFIHCERNERNDYYEKSKRLKEWLDEKKA